MEEVCASGAHADLRMAAQPDQLVLVVLAAAAPARRTGDRLGFNRGDHSVIIALKHPTAPAVRWSLDPVLRSRVDDGVMRTSELARRTGVNSETLRYYERRGLLELPPRTRAGYRDYPAQAVSGIRFIKRAQELGFTLEEVDELLHLNWGGPDSCELARTVATARRADLEARIADLQRMSASLSRLIATCELPRPDRSCALLDAISAPMPEDAGGGRRG